MGIGSFSEVHHYFILQDFFHDNIRKFLDDDLTDIGKKIIECCLDDGDIDDYIALIDSEPIIKEQ